MLTTFAREARVKGKYRISTFLAIEIGIKYLKMYRNFLFFSCYLFIITTLYNRITIYFIRLKKSITKKIQTLSQGL